MRLTTRRPLALGFIEEEFQFARSRVVFHLRVPCGIVLLDNERGQFRQFFRRKIADGAFNFGKAHSADLCAHLCKRNESNSNKKRALMVLVLWVAVLEKTAPALDTVDVRHSPPEGQAAICLPDDPANHLTSPH